MQTQEALYTSGNALSGDTPGGFSLQQIFRAAMAQHHAVAVWRLPNAEVTHACVSLLPGMVVPQPNLEHSPFGFLLCPFVADAQHDNLFIKGDLSYNTGLCQLTAAPGTPETVASAFRKVASETTDNNWHPAPPASQHSYQQEASFKAAVARAVEAIRAGEMEKVVMSRNYLEPLPPAFDPIVALEAMLQVYPRAFVSLVSIPGVGTWMGASPEILVSVDEEKVFRTVALAGTQPAAGTTSVANASWRQKEIEEQAMVERYILKCFKALRLRDYTEVGPRTVVAGNLMHLRTDFKVNLKEVDFPTLGSDMLQLLHPTSAVCGLPKEPSLQFIQDNEGYDRSFYSGYLGPVNSTNGTHLYVNLRCMEILARHAILYAGAGITAESDPAHEWQETQHKMQTMRRILTNVH
ncbi:chorismate-binding protein [Pontibacter sp. E15-1]|uniref:chorismate-binding protein n=1 Tax=Pontibacter sp. E15-1 TaxID=2919918 RepID=UPI001F4F5764|nr:chorismate-binding protein [Pontibacter sp. E15-1]MCJ8167054.1 chorismate-binding protein [Pontibacter sp. E15-1]